MILPPEIFAPCREHQMNGRTRDAKHQKGETKGENMISTGVSPDKQGKRPAGKRR